MKSGVRTKGPHCVLFAVYKRNRTLLWVQKAQDWRKRLCFHLINKHTHKEVSLFLLYTWTDFLSFRFRLRGDKLFLRSFWRYEISSLLLDFCCFPLEHILRSLQRILIASFGSCSVFWENISEFVVLCCISCCTSLSWLFVCSLYLSGYTHKIKQTALRVSVIVTFPSKTQSNGQSRVSVIVTFPSKTQSNGQSRVSVIVTFPSKTQSNGQSIK